MLVRDNGDRLYRRGHWNGEKKPLPSAQLAMPRAGTISAALVSSVKSFVSVNGSVLIQGQIYVWWWMEVITPPSPKRLGLGIKKIYNTNLIYLFASLKYPLYNIYIDL